MDGITKRGLTLQRVPTLHYSVDLRIQPCTEPVPLKHGKLATKYSWIYGYFYSVQALRCHEKKHPSGFDSDTVELQKLETTDLNDSLPFDAASTLCALKSSRNCTSSIADSGQIRLTALARPHALDSGHTY